MTVGDFAQLPPVGDVALYKLSGDRSVWEAFTSSSFLREAKRSSDVEFNALLDRLRSYTAGAEDYGTVSEHLLSAVDRAQFATPRWANHARIVTYRNPLRIALNNARSVALCRQLKLPTYVSVAEDRRVKDAVTTLLADADRQRLLEQLSDTKADGLPGLLPLAPYMPYRLTTNMLTTAGLAKGAEGILYRVYFHPDEHLPSTLAPGDFYPLRKHPFCVVVHFPDCTLQTQMPGIRELGILDDDPHLVPLRPVKGGAWTDKVTKLNIRRVQVGDVSVISCLIGCAWSDSTTTRFFDDVLCGTRAHAAGTAGRHELCPLPCSTASSLCDIKPQLRLGQSGCAACI